jgi:hypothetical protein
MNTGPQLGRLILSSALMLIVAIGDVRSDDRKGGIEISGWGGRSCGKWISARSDHPNFFTHEEWVLGFLSGAAVYDTEQHLNPLSGTDRYAVVAWIDKYCRDHPLKLVIEAAQAFVMEHPR